MLSSLLQRVKKALHRYFTVLSNNEIVQFCTFFNTNYEVFVKPYSFITILYNIIFRLLSMTNINPTKHLCILVPAPF